MNKREQNKTDWNEIQNEGRETWKELIRLYWLIRLGNLVSKYENKMNEKSGEGVTLEVSIQNDGNKFLATIPALPGLVGDGAIRFEALFRALQAVPAYLRSLQKNNEFVPNFTSIKIEGK